MDSLPVEPSGVPGQRSTKSITHPASTGTVKEHGHNKHIVIIGQTQGSCNLPIP